MSVSSAIATRRSAAAPAAPGALHHRFQEAPVVGSDVEAGNAAVAEIADVHVAGLLDDVEHRDSASLRELTGALGRSRALGERAGRRMQRLDGDLSFDVDVGQCRIGRGADEDQRRRDRTLRSCDPLVGNADSSTTSRLSGPAFGFASSFTVHDFGYHVACVEV